MEKRIKAYEAEIEKKLKKPTKELLSCHQNMVQNFQHERLVHLIIMVFFLTLTIFALTITVLLAIAFKCGSWLDLAPAIAMTALLVIMSFCYVKHYYFLENHIQKLYDVTSKIAEKLEK